MRDLWFSRCLTALGINLAIQDAVAAFSFVVLQERAQRLTTALEEAFAQSDQVFGVVYAHEVALVSAQKLLQGGADFL